MVSFLSRLQSDLIPKLQLITTLLIVFASSARYGVVAQEWAAEGTIESNGLSNVEFGLPSIDSIRSNWSDGKLDFKAAITLAELSVLAYNDEHSRVLTLRLIGFDEIVTLDDGPMSGFMARRDDVAVIAFRGTNMTSPADWMTNINFYLQTRMDRDRKFHRGFQNAYERFSNEIRLNLASWNPKHLWITGHSLGGAMAVCCAYDCLMQQTPIAGLITYGQPRVANPSMAQYLNQQLEDRYLRFINSDDIVPSVPPSGPRLISDYEHAGHTAWFTNGTIERDNRLMTKSADDSDDTESMTSPEDQITVEQLNELQALLRLSAATQPPVAPAFDLDDDNKLFDSPPLMLALPPEAASTEKAMRVQGFTNRFSDHSMLEYVRRLNDMRAVF
ncbi:MAG: lipase family protein [bacterium]|nr:lipase family protein [bacterium]